VIERKLPPDGVYYTLARSTRTNLAAGDDYGIARAALSFSAQIFDKGLVAPSIWYFIGGFPALAVYTGLSFLVWRFAKKGFTKGFAAVPLALERLTGFVPSMVSAVFITLAATFTPTAKLHKGIMAWFGSKDRAPYEQGGFPLSALAWSLHVSLGGAVQELSGSAIKGEWVGPKGATAKVDHGHIRRAIYISIIAHILYMAALLGAYMWASVLGWG
jgi:adenosylcobinamide-phosphate synthase